jgi:hypothetical protein
MTEILGTDRDIEWVDCPLAKAYPRDDGGIFLWGRLQKTRPHPNVGLRGGYYVFHGNQSVDAEKRPR